MKIALVKPPGTYAEWYKRPLLGISYLAAVLEKSGINCRIIDADYHSWTLEECVAQIREYGPDVLGITAMTHEIVQASEIGARFKEAGIPVVIGGCHVTALPRETLEEFPVFDYGIYGEGEKTIFELLDFLKGGATGLSSVQGLVYRQDDVVTVNPPRPFLTSEELDALPYPAFHHYYGDNPQALRGKHAHYIIFASRGCPYRCAFCMQVLGRQVRRRSAENIYGEIEYAIRTYGAHTIDFADEIFLFNTHETHELLNMMIDRRLYEKIRWSGLVRANLITAELIGMAKKAGCYHLEMGVESGDDGILKAIHKGITVAQIENAVRIIKEAGITIGTYFILGHPNDTRETVQKTIDLATRLNTDTIAVGLMVPYPGTQIFDMAKRGEGGYTLLSCNWAEYDKYGGKSLELKGLPYEELSRLQRLAFLQLYLKNRRYLDALRFFWQYKSGIWFMLKKRFSRTKKRPGNVRTSV
ncbi:cobalamin-dependent protein [bacterium]|nr:cobalamin-dependent protein [bacterium]